MSGAGALSALEGSGLPDTICSRAWVRDLAWFIGETARPLAIDISAAATGAGFLMGLGAGELTVMAGLTGALFAGKVWEKNVAVKADADVKKNSGGVTS